LLRGLSAATGVETKLAPPSDVALMLLMRTFDRRTLAEDATDSRTATAIPGGGPLLARRSAPLMGSW